MHNTLANRAPSTYDQLSEQQRHDLRDQVTRFLGNEIDMLDVSRQFKSTKENKAKFESTNEIACNCDYRLPVYVKLKPLMKPFVMCASKGLIY
jgi:hypothetical protein